ncbi:MAG: hypothetical protein HHJ15_16670 [Rhodoferax sp.]|uniref:hypothetical protein n=1 Tax=Rhodoferax sp. TaxID=50421 RepID=UPI0017F2AEAA|nr:hypothetical protein [Rhodoferax sp.]NMM21562.1 hypothetical protein [Rhodoferax sp.]
MTPAEQGALQMLQIFKDEALMSLAENERVIARQKERITELEFHLSKCRDVAYTLIGATAGLIPNAFVPDAKQSKKSRAKS